MFSKLCLAITVFCVFLNNDVFVSGENSVCSEPLKTGNCKAAFFRYGYNKSDGRCVQFIYGGCQGNGNNFQTLKECLQACKPICLQPLESGICRADISRFGFSSEQEKCVKFSYGGCNANENNFETMAECQVQCEVENKQPILAVDDL